MIKQEYAANTSEIYPYKSLETERLEPYNIKSHPDNAKQLQDDYHIQGALSNFSKPVGQYPESPDVLNMQAEKIYQSGNRDEAKETFIGSYRALADLP